MFDGTRFVLYARLLLLNFIQTFIRILFSRCRPLNILSVLSFCFPYFMSCTHSTFRTRLPFVYFVFCSILCCCHCRIVVLLENITKIQQMIEEIATRTECTQIFLISTLTILLLLVCFLHLSIDFIELIHSLSESMRNVQKGFVDAKMAYYANFSIITKMLSIF